MRQNIRTGIVFALASTFFLAASHVIAKLLSDHYHPAVITFFRSLIALAIIIAWALLARKKSLLKTNQLKAQIFRGIAGNIGLFLVISAYASLSVSDISAILNTSPLFAVIMAFFLLGERLTWQSGIVLALGFCGALLIIQPSGNLSVSETLLALSASLAIAVQTIIIRYLGRTDEAVTTVFYYSLTGSVLMLPALPFSGQAGRRH